MLHDKKDKKQSRKFQMTCFLELIEPVISCYFFSYPFFKLSYWCLWSWVWDNQDFGKNEDFD